MPTPEKIAQCREIIKHKFELYPKPTAYDQLAEWVASMIESRDLEIAKLKNANAELALQNARLLADVDTLAANEGEHAKQLSAAEQRGVNRGLETAIEHLERCEDMGCALAAGELKKMKGQQ